MDDLSEHPGWNRTESLSLHLETPYEEGDYLANRFEGWFLPPKTARYRFYMSCDDMCQVFLGNTPN